MFVLQPACMVPAKWGQLWRNRNCEPKLSMISLLAVGAPMTWWRHMLRRIAGIRKHDSPPPQTAASTSAHSGEASTFYSVLPRYAALERSAATKEPRDFSDLENSPQIERGRDQFETELLSPAQRPAEDKITLVIEVLSSSKELSPDRSNGSL